MVGMVAVRVGPPDPSVGVTPLLPRAVRVVVAEAVVALLILGVVLGRGHMGGGGVAVADVGGSGNLMSRGDVIGGSRGMTNAGGGGNMMGRGDIISGGVLGGQG